MLRYVIISAHLMMALKVQAQCESPAVGENLNMTEISDQQTFPEGYTVKFKCSTGYIPERTSASRSITCIGNQWSKLQLQCKKKSCGKPGEILHGKYLFPEGFRYGATIKAQCNEGYQLIGYPVRNCRETGWDKTHPVCEVVKCINPPSVPDGVFEPEEEVYNYGDGVYYSCKRGLDLFGPSLLTCSNDGTFQPAPPRCLFVTCERPEILNAVRIEGKSPPYKYSDFVRYRCNEGYKMEGSDFLICKEDGWDPPPPQCTKICDPQTIQNAVIVGISSLYRYNDSVQIRCNEGYKTVGSDRLTCGVNGWSPGFSPCTVVTCLPPILIHHGQFNPQEKLYEYGNSITFTCNEGFKLNGSASSSCTEHGIFQPSPPQCEEIFCDPQNIQNAVIVGNSSLYRYNDSVQIRFVTYERPEILNGVKVEEKSPPYKYKDIVRYRCNKGYKMEGSDRMTCKEDGWDPPPPQCTIVTCLPPPLIHNGQFNPQEELYEYGNSVTFTCNEGFKLKGSASSSCTEHGIFQPSAPQCEEIFCDPQTIQNAVIVGNSSLYRYKDSVQIRCNRGYKTVGSDRLTCGVNGWRPGFSPCTVVTCEIPKILNADKVQGKWPPYKYRAFVRYRCNKGYKMEGSDHMICKEDGWDPPPPQCTIVTCSPPPLINNGQFTPQKDLYEYGNRVTYMCNEGYILKGSIERSCTEHGRFQSPPQCQVVKCSRPPPINNGKFNPQKGSYKYESKVTYTCNEGFQIKGPIERSCTKDGIFHPSPPQCEAKSCGNPGDISHGKYLTPDGILFGATATAQCDEGYMLVGVRTRNCRDDGWDGRAPVCEVPDAKLIPVLVNVSSSVPPAEQTTPKSMD